MHTWQALEGFAAPDANVVPPMTHAEAHAPAEQTSPAPQAVPVVTFDHALVDDAGVHTWQTLAGFTVVPA